ncbi:MAG: transcriptional repressor [Flavobacteriales bacterium]|nr:transcriptional repressor [Flavobacteriales bacterium]MCX7650227.1 transcriptional repressor [Flavobacteriales bacterium]MDW8431312.1 transcriptional repressor [Flavobacteriales bacterium]
MTDQNIISQKLKMAGLKVTPQRLAVYQELISFKNHPTAEMILDKVRQKHPGISVATIYKILESFEEKGLVRRVKSDSDVMRYDSTVHAHHHLYCTQSDRIEDYEDSELDAWIAKYFERKSIPGFSVKEITLQIHGIFHDVNKDKN